MRTAKILPLILIASGVFTLLNMGCYFRPKAPATLRIIFTSDTQGMMTPCGCVGGPRGGLAKRATVIAEARESAPGPVLVLDTGNFSSGFMSNTEILKTQYIVEGMAAIGYDAVNVGRRDARRPREGVSSYNSENFPLTSAFFTYNDDDTGEQKYSYPTRIIREVGEFRIAIVGSTLDAFISPNDLGYQNDPGSTAEDLYNTLNDISVRDAAQMILVISDLAVTWQSATIAAERYPQASIVIAGEAAPVEFRESKSGEQITHPILIPRAVSWGRSVGVLDLELTESGGISSYNLEYIDLNEDVEDDPAMLEVVDAYLAAVDAQPQDIPQVRQTGYLGSNACRDCHLYEYEDWEASRHAGAWDTLESVDRLNEATCIPCHTTGYAGADQFPSRMVPHEYMSVGCEACHGPGEIHVQFQEWQIYGELTGEVRGEDLVDPIVLTPPESTCLACHQPPYDEGWSYSTKMSRAAHE